MAELRFKSKENKKICLPLKKGMKPILMGRTGNVAVLLPNSSVSRKHCVVREEQGRFVIEDLESANGTRINGELLKEPRVLADGDHVLCGEVSVFFLGESKGLVGSDTLKLKDENSRKAGEKPKSKGLQRRASEKKGSERSPSTEESSAKPAPSRGKQRAPANADSARVQMLSRVEARLGGLDSSQQKSGESGQAVDAQKLSRRLSQIEKDRDEWRAKATAAAEGAPDAEELITLQKERSQLATEVQELRERYEDDMRANRELEERSVRYSMQLESVTEKYREVREEMTLLKERLEEERQGRGEQEDLFEDSERNLRIIRDEVEELRANHAERDKLFRELKIKVTERDRTIVQLQEENAELEYEKNEASEESNRLQATFNRDSDETQRMEKRLEQLREVIRDKENLVTELREELEEKDREVIAVRMGEGIQGIEDERQALMEDFYKKSRDLDASRDRLNELERQAGTLRDESAEIREKLSDAKEEAENAQGELKALTSSQKDSEKEGARLKGRIEDLESHVVELEGALAVSNPDLLKASEARVKSLTLEVDEIRKKMGAMRSEAVGSSSNTESLTNGPEVLNAYENVEDGFISLRTNLKMLESFVRDIRDALVPVFEKAAEDADMGETLGTQGVEAALGEFEKVKDLVSEEADLLKRELALFRNTLGGN